MSDTAPLMPAPVRVVVGAAIVRGGLVLAARRSAPTELAGGWEFPGGKVEAGECEREAVVRECREELGVDVELGAALGESVISSGVLLRVYLVTMSGDEPEPLQDHDELRWLSAEELGAVPWLTADRPFLPAVAAHLRL